MTVSSDNIKKGTGLEVYLNLEKVREQIFANCASDKFGDCSSNLQESLSDIEAAFTSLDNLSSE